VRSEGFRAVSEEITAHWMRLRIVCWKGTNISEELIASKFCPENGESRFVLKFDFYQTIRRYISETLIFLYNVEL
jgi:hypothetical protein